MADCDDRQLTEAQRVAGYQNQRTGVRQALRPFSGSATLPNLLDYINRELVPAVRSTRAAVNDVYLPVIDNAPSANPLSYYFDAALGPADPTAGRVRLNASPENTSTVVSVSETNARLNDATPWLEVMSGGPTTPLGVVTLSDAINPARFIRANLDTMTDQGTYWDLGITPIESSHDDPFVDGGGLVISFIPGVADGGVTVPPGSLTPIAAESVLGNPTSSPAAPVAIALNDLSVLGRAGVLGTHVAGIDVPGTGTFTGESVFLRVASTRLAIQWRPWTLVDMPMISDSSFVGNVTGATARPAYTSFGALSSTSVTFEFTNKTFIREALTGDVTALQNNNTVTINNNAVTNAKLRDSGPLSVIGNATASTADPADISAVNGGGGVLRESGGTLGFGTIATAGIADNSVTNAKLAQMAQSRFKGRAEGAGTGDPVDLTPTQAVAIIDGENVTWTGTHVFNGATFTVNGTGSVLVNAGATAGGIAIHAGLTAKTSAGTNRVTITADSQVILEPTDACRIFTGGSERLEIEATGAWQLNNAVGSAGNVFTSQGAGTTPLWQTVGTTGLTDNAVTNAKLRDSGALSVIGRSANSSGDPADISATAASGAVLRESGSTLGFGTIATAGITNNAVTNAKLAQMAQGTTKGRANTAGTGDPTDLTGAQLAENILITTVLVDSTTTGTQTAYSFPAPNNHLVFQNTTVTLQGVVARAAGTMMWLRHTGTGSTTIEHESGSAASADTLSIGGTPSLVLTNTQQALFVHINNRWRLYGTSIMVIAEDKGDITVTGVRGQTWTIDNNVVSDAKLRDSAALSVIGRSANSTGDPADIAAANDGEVLRRSGTTVGFGTIATAGVADNAVTNAKLRDSGPLSVIGRSANSSGDPADISAVAASDSVLRESGSTLGFGTIATGGITDDAVTNAKIRNSGALSVIGRSANSTGDPADISATAATDAVLRESGSTLGFGTIATGGIANNAVTDAKLRQGGALSVVGRSANSTGNVADISGTASSDQVLRVSGTTLGFGTVATAGITDDAVTNAKLANMSQSLVKGRASGAGTGDPQDLTGSQLGDILSSVAITWNAAQTFNDRVHLINVLTSSDTSPIDNKAIGNSNVWRLNTGSATTLLRGIVATSSGQTLRIINISTTNLLRLIPEDTGSTAGNRLLFAGTSIDVNPLRAIDLWYDGSDGRWRPILLYP